MFQLMILSTVLLIHHILGDPLIPSLQNINALQVNIDDYPYQISVRSKGEHICGGGVLNENTVITAAHCVYFADPFHLSIHGGSTFKSSGGVMVNVSSIHIPDKYNKYFTDFDVAILKTVSPLSIKPIQIIPYNEYAAAITAGTELKVTGWGALQNSGKSTENLHMVAVPVVDLYQCQSIYDKFSQITERQICAGAKGKDACEGDSGGPLVYENYLVGIVSWGNGCGIEGYPTVYTNVFMFMDWIERLL